MSRRPWPPRPAVRLPGRQSGRKRKARVGRTPDRRGRRAPSLPGAATAQETATILSDSDFDPVTPTGSDLLAELGLAPRSVREALADDRARRCPDREVLAGRDGE